MITYLKTLVDMGAWIIVGLIVVVVLLGLIYERLSHVIKAIK